MPSKAFPSDLAKLLRPILPNIPSFKSHFEPRDLYSDYLEEEAVKEGFIQATAKTRIIQFGKQSLETAGCPNSQPLLAQAVLDKCYGQEGPEVVFQVPDACIDQKKRSVVTQELPRATPKL
ncbi:hypothetical protein TNIN_197661 [Trichonephila inaurata madagascariensis]|uniref:Uncharacterized protein n=1 Tax=Trichonephila inaurata madagascariensis TaxID=2747483 RepID=A0A8X6WY54_9ARAC|nr:hypothetical protein TNIN_197661 [Trichonephila inaurata madagascariensis]